MTRAAGRQAMTDHHVAQKRRLEQPPFPVYPHVYPPRSLNAETQHPCAFPADLPEQVQNLE